MHRQKVHVIKRVDKSDGDLAPVHFRQCLQDFEPFRILETCLHEEQQLLIIVEKKFNSEVLSRYIGVHIVVTICKSFN